MYNVYIYTFFLFLPRFAPSLSLSFFLYRSVADFVWVWVFIHPPTKTAYNILYILYVIFLIFRLFVCTFDLFHAEVSIPPSKCIVVVQMCLCFTLSIFQYSASARLIAHLLTRYVQLFCTITSLSYCLKILVVSASQPLSDTFSYSRSMFFLLASNIMKIDMGIRVWQCGMRDVCVCASTHTSNV